MKQALFLYIAFFSFTHLAMSQTVQTWTYAISCYQNPAFCEYYHDQVIIAFDSTRLGVVFIKQTEVIERVIINASTDSLFYVMDSLQLVYAGSLDGIDDSLASTIQYVLDSNYSEVMFSDTTQVYVSSMAHENQKLSIKSWITSASLSIPIETSIPQGLIPFLNNIIQMMPAKAIVQTQNMSLNLELVYELTSNVSSQGSSLLEIDDSMTLKSISEMY